MWILGLLFSSVMLTPPAEAQECRPLRGNPCGAELCLLPGTPAYARPTAWIRTPRAQKVRIHFHGWTQQASGAPQNPAYDFAWPKGQTPGLKEVEHMIRSYGMDQGSCSQGETVLMPLSRGHVDDYKKSFTGVAEFNTWVDSVRLDSGLPLELFNSIHLSAHSGGGAIAARVINPSDLRWRRVTLYDATYDAATASFFRDWIRTDPSQFPERTLEVYSVTSPTLPYAKSITLSGTIRIRENIEITRNGDHVLARELRTDQQLDHYRVVPARWNPRLSLETRRSSR